jgi:hypothetical protein
VKGLCWGLAIGIWTVLEEGGVGCGEGFGVCGEEFESGKCVWG